MKLNGDRLRREMAIRGLTGQDLAQLTSSTPSTISNAVQGREIRSRTARAIAVALGRTPVLPGMSNLIPRDYEPTRQELNPGTVVPDYLPRLPSE